MSWPTSAVRPGDPATSRLAAAEHAGRPHLRTLVHDALRRRGADGATDDELWRELPQVLLGSLSKRRGELVAGGLVANTGRCRPTRRGRPAVVWALAEHVDRVPAVVPNPVAALAVVVEREVGP